MREHKGPVDLELFGPGEDVLVQANRMLELARAVNEATEGVRTKALVATRESQGTRAGDFYECTQGELVCVGGMCPDGTRDPYSECGCARAFYGLASHQATSTALVTMVPLSRDDYVEAFRSSVAAQGLNGDVECEALEMLDLVADWRPGTTVERRGWEFTVRRLPPLPLIGEIP
jgi:hypothetical protein